ncbi:FMN-binding split barrel [Niveomyces insectorum RCEF 264]|uniref:pyridoxal 5'-phosphate synthase n=1 Tax=Niveomyces insectorum RCEF 264 TaxID=1081102 RepID=A0A167NTK4_9HYPO|nr:FMN-binding split barrel [Niveomyces insectorum RCEF 264]
MADSDQSARRPPPPSLSAVLAALAEPFDEVDFAALPVAPHDTFRAWLDDAVVRGVQDPHALTLSTVDAQGRPDARVVGLRKLDARGWHFSTNAASAKGQQLAANAHVALTFFWPRVGRQVRLRGRAVPLTDNDDDGDDDDDDDDDDAERVADFAAKPYWSRVVTLGSQQSQVLHDRAALRQSLAEARARLDADPGLVAAGWRVYAVQPDTAEFWEDAPDRVHRRLQYVRTGDQTWEKRELWP